MDILILFIYLFIYKCIILWPHRGALNVESPKRTFTDFFLKRFWSRNKCFLIFKKKNLFSRALGAFVPWCHRGAIAKAARIPNGWPPHRHCKSLEALVRMAGSTSCEAPSSAFCLLALPSQRVYHQDRASKLQQQSSRHHQKSKSRAGRQRHQKNLLPRN